MEEDYYAILDCVQRDRDVYRCPALILRRLSEDQYGRLRPKSQHFKPPPSSPYWPNDGYRSVYVRQQPVYYHLPQFRLSPLNVESGLGSSDGVQYRLLDKYPAHNWNSATMTLKVQYSRKLQAMGIFRFQSIDKTHEKVDVVVGLRRLNTMEWEGWCFQLSYRDRSLEHAFHEINKRIESELAKSSREEITPRRLRDVLGEDSSLASSATVEGIQLQGRLYISILVTLTAEIHTYRELIQIPKHVRMPSISSNSFTSPATGVKALTELYCCTTSSLFALDHYGSNAWVIPPVRSKYPEDGMGTVRGDFMKPLHDFLAFLKQKSPSRQLSVTEQLAKALFTGEASQVQSFLAYSAPNIETRTTDEHGFAPLHWAVAGGSQDCITLLLRNGANPKALTSKGLSAIHVAVLCNNKVWTAMERFCVHSEPGQLANARTEHFLETPLHMAAASSPDTEYGVSFFKELFGWSWEHTGNAPRNRFDETPLHRAAAANCVGAVRALALHPGAPYVKTDQYGRTPLWHAAAAGALGAVAELIDCGYSVSLTDDLGRSPLHAACRGGHREVVALLLRHGARTDTETNFLSLLPMDLAAMFGFAECLGELLWRMTTQTQLDRTLQIAASFGWYDCVELLCRHGANPFATSDYYLRRSEDGHAVVVEAEMDAYSIALAQCQPQIVNFFDTSETCKHLRQSGFPPGYNSSDNNATPGMADPIPASSTPAASPPPGAAPLPNAPQTGPAYGNARHSGAVYGTTPSNSSSAYTGTPSMTAPSHGNRLSYSLPYTSQQGLLKYQSPSQYGSANLPAHRNSAYSFMPPMAPTMFQRLQELANTYERTVPYIGFSAPAGETSNPASSSSGANASISPYVEALPQTSGSGIPVRRVSVRDPSPVVAVYPQPRTFWPHRHHLHRLRSRESLRFSRRLSPFVPHQDAAGYL
ncbi:ankyrin [Trichoderma reesei RUT C-30]|uniref:Ankyrin n=1 Tax=Hypocrea jecorina (strain ATCC 56765 / BCRC 32924 / NRRL 11460 / Rut C-30) TaxID=1344414 RepID=A0A024SEH4_HYPJR|nr:ankyrin [Trichoderma reesei RUT C-30]